ncbi:MAG: hypothetical protein ACC645_17110 [Pirellulales bacterium]
MRSGFCTSPRLSILNLMVGTACIGLYLRLSRSAWVGPTFEIQGGDAALWAVWGIGSGAALGGLVLLMARRRKGLPFPVHPGEIIFVLLGFESSIEVFSYGLTAIYELATGNARSYFFQSGLPCIQSLMMAGLFAGAAFRTTSRRWRIMFFCTGGSYVAYFFLICLGPLVYFTVPLIADVVLLAVVTMDHWDGQRYPWTHWMGVILDLWSIPMIGLWIALYARLLW